MMIDNDLAPPSTVRGMLELDKEAFTKVISVPYFTISSDFNKILSLLKPYFLKMDSLKPVQGSSEGRNKKEVILNPTVISSFQDFAEDMQVKLKGAGLTDVDLKRKDITLKYENWKADAILKAVLPTDVVSVTGYTVVGHVIHLNLRDEHMDHKKLIGTVLLDKTKNVRTVVNKVNGICNTYRNFSMEILAGDDDTLVTLKENGCTFEFDFSLVYWNSRLSTEHERIVAKLRANDTLFDVFAGVGPFAVPAAKKNCIVYANDLNPESSRWLSHNVQKNNVGARVHVSTLDGRDFVTSVVKPKLLELWRRDKQNGKIHIVMNLPAIAIEFLDVFRNLFGDVDVTGLALVLPIVHCYCFVRDSDNCNAKALEMVQEHLGCSLDEETSEVAFVRNVAPMKEMFRVSFQVPANVLFNHKNLDEPCMKKIKLTE